MNKYSGAIGWLMDGAGALASLSSPFLGHRSSAANNAKVRALLASALVAACLLVSRAVQIGIAWKSVVKASAAARVNRTDECTQACQDAANLIVILIVSTSLQRRHNFIRYEYRLPNVIMVMLSLVLSILVLSCLNSQVDSCYDNHKYYLRFFSAHLN